jgi:hypothetical protein
MHTRPELYDQVKLDIDLAASYPGAHKTSFCFSARSCALLKAASGIAGKDSPLKIVDHSRANTLNDASPDTDTSVFILFVI